MNYKIGDQVLLRNYKKKSKFGPDYLPEKFVIMEVLAKRYILLVKSLNTHKCLTRHPNGVNIFEGDIADDNAVPDNSDKSKQNSKQNYYTANPTIRRSDRIRKPNARYYNNDFVT